MRSLHYVSRYVHLALRCVSIEFRHTSATIVDSNSIDVETSERKKKKKKQNQFPYSIHHRAYFVFFVCFSSK